MNDRVKELKAFEETKSGVKGLVDSGITNLPKIFIRPPDELAEELNYGRGELKNLQVPVIDLAGIETDDLDRRKEIICEVKQASKDWGFFQVLNHGVPLSVMSSMLDGIRMFHEQDAEMKQKLYSGDRMKKVTYGSNTVDLYRSSAASWRDTLSILLMLEDHIEPEELPEICRDSAIEYMNHLTKLGETLFEILSEALSLERDHILSAVGSGSGRAFICHYYPACPQPELTLGITKHTDPTFMTILLQDQIGGLQVFRDNDWVDIQPQPGTFVVNIGDFLQIVSNDAFKSGEHRVMANKVGPRISVASFFGGVAVPPKVYGPIQELISEESPPLYKEFTVGDFMSKTFSRPFAGSIASMATTKTFFNFTAFCYLIASMGLQVIWSLGLALLDVYALIKKKVLHNPVLVGLFVIGDWVTATLSLGAAASSAGITVLYFGDLGSCNLGDECTKYKMAVALAFLSWITIAISSLIMFWLLAAS